MDESGAAMSARQVRAAGGFFADGIATPSLPSWTHSALAAAIFGCAVFLRLGGIPHVEPILFHPDEIEFVGRALRILRTGDWNPHWFAHPGSLTIYNLAVVYAAAAALRDAPVSELLSEYARDPTPFHVLGKYVTVFWSMVGLFGLWSLARQFIGKWPALLATGLLAFSPLDITIASLVRTDTHQSALLVFVGVFAIVGCETGKMRWFAFAGLTVGLASAVKWPSVAISPALAVAALLTPGPHRAWRPTRRRLACVAVAALASAMGLFLASPYVFFDFGTVVANVSHEGRARDLGPSNAHLLGALAYYFGLLAKNVSALGLALAGLGALLGLQSAAWRKYVILLVFFSGYLLLIGLQTVHWPRWGVPLLAPLCLLCARGVVGVAELGLRIRWTRAGAGRLVGIGLAASLGLLLGLCVVQNTIDLLGTRARTEPSVAATRFITEHVPPGSKVLTERAAPYLPRGMFEVYVALRGKGQLERVKVRSHYYVPVGQVGYLKDARAALKTVDYVVLGNYHSRLRQQPKGHARELEVYARILRSSKVVYKAGSYRVLEVQKDER